MPESCVAGMCSRQARRDGISLHRFPSGLSAESTKLRRLWVRFVCVNRADFSMKNVTERSVLCSMHFVADDFENKCMVDSGFAKKLILKPSAIPSVHLSELEKCSAADTAQADCPAPAPKRRKYGARRKREIAELLNENRTKQPNPNDADSQVSFEPSEQEEEFPSTASSCSCRCNCEVNEEVPKRKSDKMTQVGMKPRVRSEYIQACVSTRDMQTQTDSTTSECSSQCLLLEPNPLSPFREPSSPFVPEDSDSDYMPGLNDSFSSGDEHSDQLPSLMNHEVCLPWEEEKYIVFKSKLVELLTLCPTCGHDGLCRAVFLPQDRTGSMVRVKRICFNCQFTDIWSSQPFLGPTSLPAGNILLSAAILFTGSQFSKIDAFFKALSVRTISRSTFDNHQSLYLFPVINSTWKNMQREMLEFLLGMESGLILGGDGRSDSPGHSAKFGSYTMMELRLGQVIDVPLVQSNEVKNSAGMELEGLKRSVNTIESSGLHIEAIITDRHMSIAKWIRENLVETQHYYDIWHIAKGLKKKLTALSLQRDCQVIGKWIASIIRHLYWCAATTRDGNPDVMEAKWKSIIYHVINVHNGFDTPEYPRCNHPVLRGRERKKKWLMDGSMPYLQLIDILLDKRVLKDVRRLSPIQQTSSVEAFHSVILKFAPKHTAFHYLGMMTRLFLAAMHFNENANRPRLTHPDGSKVIDVYMPKSKKGEASARWRKAACTNDYINTLMNQLVTAIDQQDYLKDMQSELSAVIIPPPLSAKYTEVDRKAVRHRIFLGFHKTLYDHTPGRCHLLEGISEGSEDIQVMPNGKAFITSGLKLITSKDTPSNTLKAKIFLFDFNNPEDPPIDLEIDGGPQSELNPHGLSIWQDPKTDDVYLYIINHYPQRDGVEKYYFETDTNTLRHRLSIIGEHFSSMNDLVLVDEDQFYFTKFLHTGHTLELMLLLSWGTVGFFNGQKSSIVADGLSIANGINMSPDGSFVYVAEYGLQKVDVFKRNDNNSLTFIKDIPVYSPIDNIDVDIDTGDIWAGSSGITHQAFKHFANSSVPCPSQVLRIRVRGDHVDAIEEVFVDSTGEKLSASSVAVRYKQQLLIGSVDNGALYCEITLSGI